MTDAPFLQRKVTLPETTLSFVFDFLVHPLSAFKNLPFCTASQSTFLLAVRFMNH